MKSQEGVVSEQGRSTRDYRTSIQLLWWWENYGDYLTGEVNYYTKINKYVRKQNKEISFQKKKK